MKYLRQLLIILSISLIGEMLHYILPLPCPASIYGMAILFCCLTTGIIKLSSVKETGRFLIEIMAVMFIPAGVGLMTSWEVLEPVLIPVGIVTVVVIILVMGIAGRVTQAVIIHDRKKEGRIEHE